MTLCQLMQMDYHGTLDMDPHKAFDEYDLHKGIIYCEGWLEAGHIRDEIGDFDLEDFMAWCKRKLEQRSEETRTEVK